MRNGPDFLSLSSHKGIQHQSHDCYVAVARGLGQGDSSCEALGLEVRTLSDQHPDPLNLAGLGGFEELVPESVC